MLLPARLFCFFLLRKGCSNWNLSLSLGFSKRNPTPSRHSPDGGCALEEGLGSRFCTLTLTLTFTVTNVFDFACGDGPTIECNNDSNATRNPTNVATNDATSTQKITCLPYSFSSSAVLVVRPFTAPPTPTSAGVPPMPQPMMPLQPTQKTNPALQQHADVRRPRARQPLIGLCLAKCVLPHQGRTTSPASPVHIAQNNK